MKIIAHGIDLVDFPRIEDMLKKHEDRFLERVFTKREQADADDDAGVKGALIAGITHDGKLGIQGLTGRGVGRSIFSWRFESGWRL